MARDICFQQAYAGAANRTCILIGKNIPRHGMVYYRSFRWGDKRSRKYIPIENKESLDPGIQMFPKILHDAGYSIAHIGKWHVTGDPLRCGINVNIAGQSFIVKHH